jgi:hypothetical protein
VNYEWRLAEFRERFDGAAPGVEQFVAFVGNDNLGISAMPEMVFDLIGEVVDVDDGVGDLSGSQTVENLIDQRCARD